VGSTAAARAIYTRATALGKRALCLGGAKNHILIVPDADEAITVRGVVDSFTGCAGQRCMASSALLAVGPVDHLVGKIVARAASVELGAGMGAIIERAARDRSSTPSIAPRPPGPRSCSTAAAPGRRPATKAATGWGPPSSTAPAPTWSARAASCSVRC
jgi:malonate-semialdehyde dehydrogenase (acetylating)/methylmalonate-semialdehyde dehydrogenase